MKKPCETFPSFIEKLYKDQNIKNIRTITFQVTEDCNLRCSYCYQINKNKYKMDFNLAKKCIDYLLKADNPYINLDNTSGIVLEFIGGEPLLEIELINQITDYFITKMIVENHPWLLYSKISICSNGTLYFDTQFQNFLKKYSHWISFSISIDGNKELHDSCRKFPNGEGSYDLAIKSALAYFSKYNGVKTTKMTFSPNNINYTFKALKNLIELGYEEIHANCVFEEGWENEHATLFYYELKKIADYVLENDLDKKISISLFQEEFFEPLDASIDNINWCGGTGSMLAIDYEGNFYPCLRYMKSSLGNNVDPIVIGNIKHGLAYEEKEKEYIDSLQAITRTSQSEDKCINCPIAKGCSWCSAYNYQYYKTLNKRAVFICEMHQARALANCYYWNKYYKKNKMKNKKEIYIPKDWALKIISEEEFNVIQEECKND